MQSRNFNKSRKCILDFILADNRTATAQLCTSSTLVLAGNRTCSKTDPALIEALDDAKYETAGDIPTR